MRLDHLLSREISEAGDCGAKPKVETRARKRARASGSGRGKIKRRRAAKPVSHESKEEWHRDWQRNLTGTSEDRMIPIMKSNNLHYIVFRDREHRTLTTAQSKERIRGKKPSASLSSHTGVWGGRHALKHLQLGSTTGCEED